MARKTTEKDLIHELQNYDCDAEVRLAFQPSWTFEHSIGAVGGSSPSQAYEILREADDEWYVVANDGEQVAGASTQADAQAKLDELVGDDETVVYIAEGDQLGYLPATAKPAIGW